jgi:hypothetical protein
MADEGGEPAAGTGGGPGAGPGAGKGKWDGPTTYAPPSLLFTRRLGFRLGLLVFLAVAPLFVLGILTSLRARDEAIRMSSNEAGRIARVAARAQEETYSQAVRLLDAVAQAPVVTHGSDTERAVYLKELQSRSPGFLDFHLARTDGTVVAGALPMAASQGLCDRQVLDRVFKTKLPAVGDFQKGTSGPPTVYVARPAGEGLALGAVMSLGWLEQFQGRLQLPEGSVLDLLDARGLNLLRLPRASAGDVGQIHPAPQLLLARLPGEERPLSGEDTDGVTRFFGIAPLVTGGTKKGFLVVVGIPEAAVVGPAEGALRQSMVVSALVLVGSLVLAQILAEQLILRRINGLILATRRLASTDLAGLRARQRVCQEPSELGDLERSFDDMARTLEKRARELDQRAKELEAGSGKG